MMLPDELGKQGQKLLAVLNEREEWVSRAQLAKALDKFELTHNDIALLRKLVQMGMIQSRQRRTSVGGNAFEYNVKP